jgi:hypothetical protein
MINRNKGVRNHFPYLLRTIYTKDTAVTLTKNECQNTLIKMTDSGAITLPVAEKELDGAEVIVSAANAGGCTVVVAAGFHGTGAGHDTVTLAQGDAGRFICDGSNWYNLSGYAST